jgi:hypothetical protein
MLVTFHSKAWSDITMFGDVAVGLLKLAGHSGAVPSALLAADVAPALAQLKQELAGAESDEDRKQDARPDDGDTDAVRPVGLGQRAQPLILLLSAAARQGCDVMWKEGA